MGSTAKRSKVQDGDLAADGAPSGTGHDQVRRSINQWSVHRPDLDVSALEVFGRVHRIYLHYRSELQAVFAGHGINAASFGVLAALYRIGPPYRLTVSELANETLVSSGGMTMRLDRLEQAGLITRERERADRRVVYAQLTETGEECASAAAESHFKNELRMMGGLDATERATLGRLLLRLEQSMNAAGDGTP